jgi:tetratricopeptide (TPR) repeat protein
MTYADMKNLPESSSNFEKSHELAKGIGDVRLQALVKLNRVELYIAINDIYAGLALENQAMQTFLQLEDHLGEAETYKYMGALYSRIEKWELANTYFEQSIFLANKYKNPLLAAESHYEFGVMEKQRGDKKSAIEHLNKAMSLFQSLNAANDEAKVKEMLASVAP